ncbi:MAG: hypothetical protein KatS3mg110_2712 [Pirellulaceae bacterium]|nr:MAG: hypothetical protein KatS3mg110_2712 [Pirellulaceae bacterium]
MERFILVDHSLSAADGHHFEYAVNVLSEAEASGYQPILVANQRFRRHAARLVPSHWEVIPLYRYSAYHRYSQESLPAVSATGTPYDSCSCVNLRDPKKSLGALFVDSLAKLGKHLRAVRDHLGKWKRVRSFTHHTHVWWNRIDPNPHDIVFFPTFTSFDLVCLVKFLAALPESSRVTWHLQFHFDFLCDEVETGKDYYVIQMRDFFELLFRRIPHHRILFYTTTEPLARQYNQLRIGDFTCLPYPVSPQLGPAPPRRDAQPISVACVGCLRPEKGYQHLQGVVDRLWQTAFCDGTRTTDDPSERGIVVGYVGSKEWRA